VLAWSIGVSILVHLLLLLLSPLVIQIGIPPGAVATPHAAASDVLGLEVIVAIPTRRPVRPATRSAPVIVTRVSTWRRASFPDLEKTPHEQYMSTFRRVRKH
jgi:hypothetical protein